MSVMIEYNVEMQRESAPAACGTSVADVAVSDDSLLLRQCYA